jgi:hypothetical protein
MYIGEPRKVIEIEPVVLPVPEPLPMPEPNPVLDPDRRQPDPVTPAHASA